MTVDFLLDTGAARTLLHPRDATTRVGIEPGRLAEPSRWPTTETLWGIGGSSIYYPVLARYAFDRDDGGIEILHKQIAVAQLRTDNRVTPSLLGWDVLRHFRVVADWSTRTVRLEKPEAG